MKAIIIPPQPFVIQRADQADGYDASHLTNDYAGVIWRTPQGSTRTLVLDLAADVPVDTLMLFGLWGNIPSATAVVNIALATSAQGPGFGGVPVDQGGAGPGSFWISRDQPIFAGEVPIAIRNGVLLWQAPAGAPPLARYVLFSFVNLTAAGFVQASRAVVGKAIRLERNFSFGASFGVKDLGSVDFSRRGVLQRASGKKMRTVGLTFSNLRKDEVEGQTKPLLERIGNTEMVALVTDPAPDVQRQNRCYFGPLVGDLGHTWVKADRFEAKTNVVSIF